MAESLRRVLDSRVVATLAAPHGVDRYLELLDPTWSMHEVRAEVSAVRRQTADSITLTLRPNGNWRGFRAGQFVRLAVEIDGVWRTRCYSPASSAHDARRIELTAKARPEGLVSKFLVHNARPGMVMRLSQAEGAFALPEQRPKRILLLSGGSGITPAMAMLRTLCDEDHGGAISFLHYCKTPDDLIYAEELAALAARHSQLSVLRSFTASAEDGELRGRFHRAQLAAAVPDYAAATTFLCGPPGMTQAVQQLWAEDGISDRLHLERFTKGPAPAAASGGEGDVRFARSERLAANDGGTLLDQAEAAGLRPESGCRMGVCHACSCRKLSGRVRDNRTGSVSADGEEVIQLCVSVPLGTVTLDI